MRNRGGETRCGWKSLFLSTAGAVALAAPLLAGVLMAPWLRAQAPAGQSPATHSATTPHWQIDAGGKMAFDVVSVKPNVSRDPSHTNVNLSGLDDSSPNSGGLFAVTKFPLNVYIGFAYKLMGNEMMFLGQELPKWGTMDRFDIQARAEGNPTRDQMRLMMQSLLADRFKLAVHWETRQLPMFGLVLEKPGKTGPQLTPRMDDPPCAAQAPAGSATTPPAKNDWFLLCGAVSTAPASGRMRVGSRNLTMGEIASNLVAASMGALNRPVVDQTGLNGSFDFRIEFTPEFNGPLPNFQPDTTGPTFLEGLKEQLGLKLVPQTGPVDVLVVDRVERPSEN